MHQVRFPSDSDELNGRWESSPRFSSIHLSTIPRASFRRLARRAHVHEPKRTIQCCPTPERSTKQ
jgi:hypothetical protein